MSRYRVRVRIGHVEVEVEGTDRAEVESSVGALLKSAESTEAATANATPDGSVSEPGPALKPESLVEFVQRVLPNGGAEYATTVGYFLEVYRAQSGGFSTADIREGFGAVHYKHSNPSMALKRAAKHGLLMDGDRAGTKQLTQKGMEWVRSRAEGESA